MEMFLESNIQAFSCCGQSPKKEVASLDRVSDHSKQVLLHFKMHQFEWNLFRTKWMKLDVVPGIIYYILSR